MAPLSFALVHQSTIDSRVFCHCRWPWHAASNYPQSTLYKNTQEFRLNTRAYLVSFLFFLYLFRTITEMWYKQSNVKTKRNMRMHPESYFLNTYWIYQWQLQWFYKTVIQTKNKYRKIMFVTKITLRRKKTTEENADICSISTDA